MDVYLGVDVGGTNVSAGLVDGDGQLLAKLKRPTEADRGGDVLVAKIDEISRELIGMVNRASAGTVVELKAAGVGIPGFLDPERGVVKSAANLNLVNYPIASRLGELLRVPVRIDNDVRMFTLGEAIAGAAVGYAHVLGITVGTGIASAIIENGEIVYGAGHLAGEIGHHLVDDNPFVCGCGMTGCLETLVSAGGIVRQAIDRLRTMDSILKSQFTDQTALATMSAADVARAADQGDRLAIEVFERTGTELGKALSVAATLLSPDIIVIGGGVSLAGERLLAPVRRTIMERTHPMYGERIIVAQAKLSDDASLFGSTTAAKWCSTN